MDKLCIIGGTPLNGEVTISGAKNAALPILCASLLTDKTIVLKNVPNLKDVQTMRTLLQQMGKKIIDIGPNQIEISGHATNAKIASYELVKTMRASILVLGPLLAKYGEARVSLPGGCAIGARPVDQHIKGLQAMGADVTIEHGDIVARAKRLKGAHIVSDMITVTGTENLLMAATLASGETIIENAACEPEVTDLANMLISLGAKINGVGTSCLVIQGVDRLEGGEHTIISDRIETGTFLCAVAATKGCVTLKNTSSHLMAAVIEKLRETGAIITSNEDCIEIKMTETPIATSFKTAEYPSFPTDMQAQLMALNCVAKGTAQVVESIFENRFMHVPELNRFGAKINIEGNTAFIEGVPKLFGAKVMATDLRASASLVIAALAAEGETLIDRIYHLDRGYDQMEVKLRQLGANVNRIS